MGWMETLAGRWDRRQAAHAADWPDAPPPTVYRRSRWRLALALGLQLAFLAFAAMFWGPRAFVVFGIMAILANVLAWTLNRRFPPPPRTE